MTKSMRTISLTILVLSFVIGVRGPCDATAIEPSEGVEKSIDPILEAAQAVRQHDSEATEFDLGRRLQEVFDDKGPTGDEALVVLLNFYIGEANEGDLLHQITLRGKRLLPLLAKHKRATVVLRSGSRFDDLRLPPRVRRQNFTSAIDFISKGKVWGVG
jgi:hypothetical protein